MRYLIESNVKEVSKVINLLIFLKFTFVEQGWNRADPVTGERWNSASLELTVDAFEWNILLYLGFFNSGLKLLKFVNISSHHWWAIRSILVLKIQYQAFDYEDGTLLDQLFFNVARNSVGSEDLYYY